MAGDANGWLFNRKERKDHMEKILGKFNAVFVFFAVQ